MTTHKLVGLAHDETLLVSDDKKKMKNNVKVRTGDAAMYGDNASENLHTTSKNEVKKISSIS